MKNQRLENNRLGAMITQVLGCAQKQPVGRVLPLSGWWRIPSVRDYKVGKSENNLILDKFGIRLKIRDKATFKKTKLNRCNRYMAHQLRRIRRYRTANPRLAWRIIQSCLKNSVSFRMSGINHVASGWYYNMDWNSVKRLSRRVNQILRSMDTNMNYHRIYIPKTNGKVRPLGVPTLEWRVSMHMVNNMLVEMLRYEVSPDQHAYIPGRGVKTAWESILRKLDKYDFIYETDLKGYFDTVDSSKIVEKLREVQTPEEIVNYIRGICMTPPKLKRNDQVDEENYRRRIDFLTNKDVESTEIGKELIQEYLGNWRWWLRNNVNVDKEELRGKAFKFLMKLWAQKDKEKASRMSTFFDGVPQGGPLSPFLSNLPLLKGYLHQSDHVSYADDHIFFMHSEKEIKDNPEYNIIHAPEKCRWIKKNGEYTEEGLKFLGFRYSPYSEGVFYAEPRKGGGGVIHKHIGTLIGSEREIVKMREKSDLSKIFEKYKEKISGSFDDYKEKMSRKAIFGFIMSCMTLDDWKNNHSLEDSRKAIQRKIGEAHPNSLMKGKIPDINESSTYGELLSRIVKYDIQNRKVSLKRGKKGYMEIRKQTLIEMSEQASKNRIENVISESKPLLLL